MYLLPGKVEPATFIRREKRFLVYVNYKDKTIRCHLANPGRMKDFFAEGDRVFIQFHNNPERKTIASVMAIEHMGQIINLQSNLVQKWLPQEFDAGHVPGLENFKIIQQEVKFGHHRLDYLLKSPEHVEYVVEVKSTTRVRDEVACFPDGVSIRAQQHLKLLIEQKNAIVIFIVQQKAKSFWPCETIDPEFTKIFAKAIQTDHVKCMVIQSEMSLVDNQLHTRLVGLLPIIKP